jgi:hypothetical protein
MIQLRCGNHGLRAVCTVCESVGQSAHLDLHTPLALMSTEDSRGSLVNPPALVSYPVSLAQFCQEHARCG